MRQLSPQTLNALRELAADNNRHDLVERIDFSLKAKRSVIAARAPREEKKAALREAWIDIRNAVFARANHRCENCGAPAGELVPDHMFGGSDRKLLQSVYTCWGICFYCNQARTANTPSRAEWLERFIRHARAKAEEMAELGLDADELGYETAISIARVRLSTLSAKGMA